jgi:hypothetical protein
MAIYGHKVSKLDRDIRDRRVRICAACVLATEFVLGKFTGAAVCCPRCRKTSTEGVVVELPVAQRVS